MPTYSYLCGACGGSFEIEQRIVEDPIKTCALCGKAEARRQIVSGNFILKGGGWYSDGYGSSKSSKSEAKTDSSGGSSAKAKTDGSSDTASTKTDSSSSTKSDTSSTSSSSSSSEGAKSTPKAASAD